MRAPKALMAAFHDGCAQRAQGQCEMRVQGICHGRGSQAQRRHARSWSRLGRPPRPLERLVVLRSLPPLDPRQSAGGDATRLLEEQAPMIHLILLALLVIVAGTWCAAVLVGSGRRYDEHRLHAPSNVRKIRMDDAPTN